MAETRDATVEEVEDQRRRAEPERQERPARIVVAGKRDRLQDGARPAEAVGEREQIGEVEAPDHREVGPSLHDPCDVQLRRQAGPPETPGPARCQVSVTARRAGDSRTAGRPWLAAV